MASSSSWRLHGGDNFVQNNSSTKNMPNNVSHEPTSHRSSIMSSSSTVLEPNAGPTHRSRLLGHPGPVPGHRSRTTRRNASHGAKQLGARRELLQAQLGMAKCGACWKQPHPFQSRSGQPILRSQPAHSSGLWHRLCDPKGAPPPKASASPNVIVAMASALHVR
eukprot:CAMPEP_0170296206 /NCGR_PEP_ID=MMETSP0116_2-20130129/48240_1 /TAXON_ID=400756 /ORGANISM="Durinskia baltica, Strain CSIRO CS-38" /LENGTH=163 /DNA_ID=CAMNT_0010547783 /DNA_START=265 /DNA_END=757 /DNA_ORIENTATION=+